jgi:hypothetical protein
VGWNLADQESAIEAAPKAGAPLDPKGLNYALWAMAVLVAGWGLFVPIPYRVAILANVVTPLLGLPLVFWSKGKVTVAAMEAWDAQIAPPFLGCGLVLCLHALGGPIQGGAAVFLYAAVPSLLLAGLAWWYAAEYTQGTNAAFMFVITLFFSAGAIANLDRVLDFSPPKLEYVKVSDKSVSGAKSRAYMVSAAPPHADQAVSFNVGEEAYDRTSVGDFLLVGEHRGAFGLKWFDLRGLYRPPGR